MAIAVRACKRAVAGGRPGAPAVSRPAARFRGLSALLAAIVLVGLAGLVLTVLGWDSLALSDAAGVVSSEAGALVYAVLGALIVRRAGGNLVGWFMLADGAVNAVMTTGSV